MKEKMKKILLGLIIALIISLTVSIYVGAEDVLLTDESEGITDVVPSKDADTHTDPTDADKSPDNTENGINNKENSTTSGDEIPSNEENSSGGDYEKNLFDEIYAALELNADKIFSALAFISTLIVGLGYKSGLLPLLRDTLTKLKGAIDGVKAEGEQTRAETDLMLREINESIDEMRSELDSIKWQYESYDQIVKERHTLCTILNGQINMLYAIFMTSALPQYQKDEIGEMICRMREELDSYEQIEEN